MILSCVPPHDLSQVVTRLIDLVSFGTFFLLVISGQAFAWLYDLVLLLWLPEFGSRRQDLGQRVICSRRQDLGQISIKRLLVDSMILLCYWLVARVDRFLITTVVRWYLLHRFDSFVKFVISTMVRQLSVSSLFFDEFVISTISFCSTMSICSIVWYIRDHHRCQIVSALSFLMNSWSLPWSDSYLFHCFDNITYEQVLVRSTYSAKSFRIGAASMCYSLNMSVEDIQALGRWASQAFMYYIRAGARAVRARSIQKKLADGFLMAIVRFFSGFFWLEVAYFS